jgi:hypothetical protein
MWKSFQHNDDLYMIKLVTNQNLDFYVTDLQNIWIQNISKETLLSQFQVNPPTLLTFLYTCIECIVGIQSVI